MKYRIIGTIVVLILMFVGYTILKNKGEVGTDTPSTPTTSQPADNGFKF